MATIEVPANYDLVKIAAAAGQPDPEMRSYHDGVFEVQGVAQKDLDAALAAYDHQTETSKKQAGLIADARYRAETAGLTVNGIAVYTDRTTQNKLTAAALRASRDPSYTVDWKCSDGSFITLTAAQIIEVADAVGDYVQACYSREAELLTAVADGSYTPDLLEQGWPV